MPIGKNQLFPSKAQQIYNINGLKSIFPHNLVNILLLCRFIDYNGFFAMQHITFFQQENTMFSNTEQFSNATKALFESQLAVFNSLTSKTVESVEKVVALNMAAVKASTEEGFAMAQKITDAKNPQAVMDLSQSQVKFNAEKAAVYSRHFADIAAGLQAEFTKAAEKQLSDTKAKVESLIDDVTKHAPKGSENAVVMLKNAISTANAGLEQLTKVTKQAVETVEAQVVKATDEFAHAVEKTVPAKGKK